MKRIISTSLLALIAFTGVPAWAQITLTDFESYTTPTANGTVLFRAPTFSGSTSSKIDASVGNTTVVESTGIPAGNPNAGLNTLHTVFNFNDTATPFWVRFTTFNVANLPNPTIGLWDGWSFQFDIYSDTPLYVTALVRETETDAALGASGGATGNIEFVGGVPTAASGRGKAVAANTWTTLVFDWSNETAAAFAGTTANGVLDPGADGKGVLDALGLATDAANTGTINVWLDNIQMVPEPSSLSLALLGGFALLVRKMRRQ